VFVPPKTFSHHLKNPLHRFSAIIFNARAREKGHYPFHALSSLHLGASSRALHCFSLTFGLVVPLSSPHLVSTALVFCMASKKSFRRLKNSLHRFSAVIFNARDREMGHSPFG
jgi:hypothetical protein